MSWRALTSADQPWVGCPNIEEGEFAIEKLNDQLQYYTRAPIAWRFRRIHLDGKHRIVLLLIPMRKPQAPVIRMAQDAPVRMDGSAAFKKGDIYARIGDKCVPVHDDLFARQDNMTP
jgi:hypothetical protein